MAGASRSSSYCGIYRTPDHTTAARSLLGYALPVLKERGLPRGSPYGTILPTIHPSALLRVQNAEAEHRLFGWLADDLRLAGELGAV